MNITQEDVLAVCRRIEQWGYPIDRVEIKRVLPRLKWVDFHRLMGRLEKHGIIGKCMKTHNWVLLSKRLPMDKLVDFQSGDR